MSKTVTIIIHPSDIGTDTLTVSDAMQQVLDTFVLLSKANAKRLGGADEFVWHLERASTNSPFTVEAVAVSKEPSASINEVVNKNIAEFSSGMDLLLDGSRVAEWIDGPRDKNLRAVLERTQNGIRRTDIYFGDDFKPVILDRKQAAKTVNFLDKVAMQEESLERTEYGSFEGYVVGVKTYYNKPAFTVRDRLSGADVKCVLKEGMAEEIGLQHNWTETWAQDRVLVTGSLSYNKKGLLEIAVVEDVSIIAASSLPISSIKSLESSDSKTISNHLSELWSDNND